MHVAGALVHLYLCVVYSKRLVDMQAAHNLPLISNIKAQIDLKGLDACICQLSDSLQRKEKVKKHNFFVVKERFTYMVYEKRGFINVTKIRNWEELFTVMLAFAESFKIDQTKLGSERLKVDNITASGNFKRNVDLNKLNIYFNKRPSNAPFPKTIYQYGRNRFSGAFVKTRQSGTVIVHKSGKYIIVGSKTVEQVNSIYQWIYAIIQKL